MRVLSLQSMCQGPSEALWAPIVPWLWAVSRRLCLRMCGVWDREVEISVVKSNSDETDLTWELLLLLFLLLYMCSVHMYAQGCRTLRLMSVFLFDPCPLIFWDRVFHLTWSQLFFWPTGQWPPRLLLSLLPSLLQGWGHKHALLCLDF